MAADVREEQTFFPFSTWLLSFTAIPFEREQLTASGLSECDSQGDPIVQTVFQVSL